MYRIKNKYVLAWPQWWSFVDLITIFAIKLEIVFCCQICSDLLWEKIVLWLRKTFEIRGWRPRICKIFEIIRTIYSNSERSEQILVTECFFNLFLEVSHISWIRIITIQTGKNYRDLGTCRKSYKTYFFGFALLA